MRIMRTAWLVIVGCLTGLGLSAAGHRHNAVADTLRVAGRARTLGVLGWRSNLALATS